MSPKCGVCSVPELLAVGQNFDLGELLQSTLPNMPPRKPWMRPAKIVRLKTS